MSFYKPQRRMGQMGLIWLAPVIDMIGGALKSTPVGSEQYIVQEKTNGLAIAAGAVGGLALVGGLVYFIWKRA